MHVKSRGPISVTAVLGHFEVYLVPSFLRFRIGMAEGSIEKGFILDPEAKMQSRIDEQSELICILKKRADQLLLESKKSFHIEAYL